MHDLLSDPQTSDMRQIGYGNDVSASSAFKTWFYQMRWFYPYCSFKHSNWWRHKLGHT